MGEETIFTKIVNGTIPATKVYEDNNFLAFMDINPINKGHVLVITKEPYKTLNDVPNDLVGEMFKLVHKLTQPIMDASGSEMFNWYVIGDEVPHAHIHIVPRFENDGKIKIERSKSSSEEIELFAQKIRDKIN